MEWGDTFNEALKAVIFLVVYAAIFLTSKLLKDTLTPYHLVEELAKRDNFAVGISLGGYFLATAIIFVGVVTGPSRGLLYDVVTVIAYSAVGLIFLNLSRWCLDKLVFHKFCDITAIVENQNCGMAAVRFGVYLATGMIAGASLYGQGGGIHTAIAFFLLGQLTLLLFARIYDWLTPYDLQAEVQNGNYAAGVAFGGTLAALGLIIAKSVYGDFVGWGPNLLRFVEISVVGIVVLKLIRVFMDRMVLTGHDLNEEIAQDRNLAAGFVEMSVSISFALVLVALI